MASAIDDLTSLLRDARQVLAFTGAGISTSCGIPDFRGPNGVWTRRQPVYFQEFLASEEKRVEYWDGKQEGFEAFRDARPSPTHRALVELERMGKLHALVTQNIDGLHQAAGTGVDRLVELHGTNRLVECLSCRRTSDPAEPVAWFREHRRTPTCSCGGWLKFATVSFGQPLPPDALARAADAARRADLALALGSTLSVHPAASIPLLTAHGGKPYVIVNRGATDHDAHANLRITDDVDAVLPAAVAALGK